MNKIYSLMKNISEFFGKDIKFQIMHTLHINEPLRTFLEKNKFYFNNKLMLPLKYILRKMPYYDIN